MLLISLRFKGESFTFDTVVDSCRKQQLDRILRDIMKFPITLPCKADGADPFQCECVCGYVRVGFTWATWSLVVVAAKYEHVWKFGGRGEVLSLRLGAKR